MKLIMAENKLVSPLTDERLMIKKDQYVDDTAEELFGELISTDLMELTQMLQELQKSEYGDRGN